MSDIAALILLETNFRCFEFKKTVDGHGYAPGYDITIIKHSYQLKTDDNQYKIRVGAYIDKDLLEEVMKAIELQKNGWEV